MAWTASFLLCVSSVPHRLAHEWGPKVGAKPTVPQNTTPHLNESH